MENKTYLSIPQTIKLIKSEIGAEKGTFTYRQIRFFIDDGVLKAMKTNKGYMVEKQSVLEFIDKLKENMQNAQEQEQGQQEENTGLSDTAQMQESISTENKSEEPELESNKEQTEDKVDIDSLIKPYVEEINSLKLKIAELEGLKNNVLALTEQLPEIIKNESSRAATQAVHEAMQQIMATIGAAEQQPPNPQQAAPLGDEQQASTQTRQAQAAGINPEQIPPSVIEKQMELEYLERIQKAQPLDKVIFALSKPGFMNILDALKGADRRQEMPQQPDAANLLLNAVNTLTKIQEIFTNQLLNTMKAFRNVVEIEGAKHKMEAKSSKSPKEE